MEVEKRLRFGLQQRLQAFVQGGVTLGIAAVVVREEPALHCVLDGFQHKVGLVQVHAVVGSLAVLSLVVRYISQEAGKKDGLLHIAHHCAVAPQGQQEGVSVQPSVGGLHDVSWVSG